MPSTPRYREIADELRDAIFAERELMTIQLTGGVKLPTEPEMADHYDVSRDTIRRALRELSAEGLIETRGRHGTFVRRLLMLKHNAHREHPDRRDATQQATTDTWFSEVLETGRTPTQDFSFRIVPASSSVASYLQVKLDELVVVRECIRYVDATPWSEQISYYPYDIAKKCGLDTPHDIKEGTVRRMAARGVRETGWADSISSRPANVDESRLFGLSPGVAVILYHRVAWTTTQPVRYTREVLPADRNIVTYESGDLSAAKRTDVEDVPDGDPAGTP